MLLSLDIEFQPFNALSLVADAQEQDCLSVWL
jgi:hypothetical protein